MELLPALKALADETRLKIIVLLEQENYCVRALAHRLDLSEAAVSQHLKSMREAGLVEGEKRSYWVHYRVRQGKFEELAEMLGHIQEHIEVEEECPHDHEGNCCE